MKFFPSRQVVLLEQHMRRHKPTALQNTCNYPRRIVRLLLYRDVFLVVRYLAHETTHSVSRSSTIFES